MSKLTKLTKKRFVIAKSLIGENVEITYSLIITMKCFLKIKKNYFLCNVSMSMVIILTQIKFQTGLSKKLSFHWRVQTTLS